MYRRAGCRIPWKRTENALCYNMYLPLIVQKCEFMPLYGHARRSVATIWDSSPNGWILVRSEDAPQTANGSRISGARCTLSGMTGRWGDVHLLNPCTTRSEKPSTSSAGCWKTSHPEQPDTVHADTHGQSEPGLTHEITMRRARVSNLARSSSPTWHASLCIRLGAS